MANLLSSSFTADRHVSSTPVHFAFDESLHSGGISRMSTDFSSPEKMNVHELRSSEDVEGQPILSTESGSTEPPPAIEYRTGMSTKLVYLGAYFLLNLSLTLYNKALLGNFKFPWLLTAIHSGFAAFGCALLESRGTIVPSDLGMRDNILLLAFSILFTVNIAMSNVSLAMVSVPFHQIMRSTTPVFAILIHRFFFSRTYNTSTYFSLIPLIIGVALTTYGDYYFTQLGFFCTLSGAILAATKTVATNRIMTGSLSLPPLELLARMSPLAAVQSLAISFLSGELGEFAQWSQEGGMTRATAFALAGNGFLAFLLNVSSFQTNKIAGALTMTVCGNVKQCLTVLFGVALFNVRVNPTNGVGMMVALGGAAWYSSLELKRKTRVPSLVMTPAPDR